MKKLRIFAAAIMCVSLLAFAGCGSNDAADTGEEGTVTEDTRNADEREHKDDSVTEDMADDAKDAVDDVKDAVDGKDKAGADEETGK